MAKRRLSLKGRKQFFAWLALLIFMTLGVFVLKPSANAAPGSNADPLVSKSYVDSKINQVIAMINSSSANAQTQTPPPAYGAANQAVDKDALKREILSELAVNSGAAFVPVRAERGQIVLGGEGAEIILRSGRASGWCSGENGLVNATSGIEIYHGFDIPVNHLILVPRDDGRGAVINSDEAWFIIKGGFQVVR